MARPTEVACFAITRSQTGNAVRRIAAIVQPFALIITDAAGLLCFGLNAAQYLNSPACAAFRAGPVA
jgi:hypothetical protein